MARKKQTKEYKKKRLQLAKQLVSDNFGREVLNVIRKKYALYRGKSDLQAEVYAFLIGEGFSYREIAKMTGKTHEAIRHTILSPKSEIRSPQSEKPVIPTKPPVILSPSASLGAGSELVQVSSPEPTMGAEISHTPYPLSTEPPLSRGELEEEPTTRIAKSLSSIDKTLYGGIFPSLDKAREYVAVDEEEEETIEDERTKNKEQSKKEFVIPTEVEESLKQPVKSDSDNLRDPSAKQGFARRDDKKSSGVFVWSGTASELKKKIGINTKVQGSTLNQRQQLQQIVDEHVREHVKVPEETPIPINVISDKSHDNSARGSRLEAYAAQDSFQPTTSSQEYRRSYVPLAVAALVLLFALALGALMFWPRLGINNPMVAGWSNKMNQYIAGLTGGKEQQGKTTQIVFDGGQEDKSQPAETTRTVTEETQVTTEQGKTTESSRVTSHLIVEIIGGETTTTTTNSDGTTTTTTTAGTAAEPTLYTAGNGIAISGNQISVAGDYSGQGSISTVGSISSGAWQGGEVQDAYVADNITASNYIPLGASFGGMVSGTYDNITVTDDSHKHTASTLPVHDNLSGAGTVDTIAEVKTVAVGGDASGTVGAIVVADDSHAHTTTTISGLDISADTNLSGDTEIVLTDDALSIALGITRDSEWNTVAELETATGADIITSAENNDGLVGTKAVNETGIATGKVLKYNSVSGQWEIGDDADTNTTYTAGDGLDLVAGEFSTDLLSTGGLSITGTELGVKLDGSTLALGAGGIKLSDSYAGQNTIATVGTITSGTWNGTAIDDAHVANNITASNYLPLAGGTMTGNLIMTTNSNIVSNSLSTGWSIAGGTGWSSGGAITVFGPSAAVNNGIMFRQNGTEIARFDNGGNLGLNTTGPDRRLDVLDASNPQLRLTQADGTVYTDLQTSSVGDLYVYNTGDTIAIGNDAIKYSTGDNNVAIGKEAGKGLATNNYSNNTFIGYQTGYSTTTGGNNFFGGYQAGYTNATGAGDVFLGYQAGYSETGSNKLYIDNSNTATPLIYGDFSTDALTVNGTLVTTGSVTLNDNDGVSNDVNLTLGDTNETGQIVFYDGSTNTGTLAMDALGADAVYTFSGATGTVVTSANYATYLAHDSITGAGTVDTTLEVQGVAVGGDLSGTVGNAAVADDSHAHTTTTVSGLDISADTNLSGDTEIVLTGDALSIASSITRDSELAAYMLLTGGTLTGTLTVNDNDGVSNDVNIVLGDTDEIGQIVFYDGSTNTGTLAMDALGADAVYTFSGATGTVWTSGNDGSSSGLDADTLDGHDTAYFMTAATDDWVNETGDTMTGNLTIQKADSSIIFDTLTATDTDFWLGVTEDALGTDDDLFQIGDGTTPGTNPFLTINTSGQVGIGTADPGAKLDISAGNIDLDNTTNVNQFGIISKSGARFIHDFNYGNNGVVTTDGYNTFLGINAGNLTMGSAATQTFQSSYNTGLGYEALVAVTGGFRNSALGYRALYSNTSGYSNIGIGSGAGYNNQTGSFNTLLGTYAGQGAAGQSYDYNTFIGYQAGYVTSTGSSNIALGYQAGYSNQTGAGNVFLGYQAGYSETGSNKLYIDNSNTATPLIYGDFSTDALTVNGVEEVNTGAATGVAMTIDQNDTDQTALDFDVNNVSGDILNMDWGAGTTLTGVLQGIDVDLTNVTADGTNAAYGIHVNDLAALTASVEYGVYVQGTNFDYSIVTEGDVLLNNAGAELSIMESVGGAFYGTLDVGDLGGNATYTFSGVSGNVVTTTNEAVFTGAGRHARKIQLNAEYAGAAISTFYGTGTDASITGNMTSDAEPSADLLRTYYEWSSSEASLNYYTVAVRVTLPEDFESWATSNAVQVDLDTETNDAANNLLSIYIHNGDDTPGSSVATSLSNKSAVADTWETVAVDDSVIDDGVAPDWDAAGETAVIYLRLGSKSDNFTRVGDIKLNYLSKG
ncbi:MAG: hypothetical protein V1690_00155 [Candidatus Moraniibacteriota bacterium]